MIINYKKYRFFYSKIIRIKNPFIEIEDFTGKIQIYSKNKVKLGDIIFSYCKIKKTKNKIFYYYPFFIKIFIKCISYKKKNFLKKKIFSIKNFIYNYLNFFMFLNIDTNNLCSKKNSSNSNNFKTFNFCKKKFFYLKISPELNIKKILSCNYNNIYELNYCFRNEGKSNIHCFEFLMLEYYSSNLTFKNSIFFLEFFIKNIFLAHSFFYFFVYKINFSIKHFFKKKSIIELLFLMFKKKKIKFFKNINLLFFFLILKNIKILKNFSVSSLIFKIFDNIIIKNYYLPIFVKLFTKKNSLLSKPNFLNLKFVNRFELYISSIEISNGFDELNDYFLQKENFKKKNKDFLVYIKNGLQNYNGVGIGIFRILMIMYKIKNIKHIK
ncbi:amino acid--tRNA ligase-related protein [Candidatus Carsonella ruddii]|uniref:Lysyl-tRNA synthetase n=1 Tax=Candidatus Carsonella ruddii PC isolate NHV TaxID=1202540 RepID=J3TWK3_CARRU|nr:amino acid--tRNA ligase-related protein [Candidatus Carsonella ruddii]AFP84345.1 lysyl-tRNA synthetase [Candidatus Carsonella ruddii PC isolate NHV]